MEGRMYTLLLVLALIKQQVASLYYHEPSRILLQASDYEMNKQSDFGFSIEYQDSLPPKMLIGAPRYDLDGRVYTCDVSDFGHKGNVKCSSVDISIQKLAPTTRSINPNQHFYLGASIAATKTNFLTCAPLWCLDKTGNIIAGTYGTCFVFNNTAQRVIGPVEKMVKKDKMNVNTIGGFGWNVFADEANDLMLILKPVQVANIYSLSNLTADALQTIYYANDTGYLGHVGYSAIVAGQFFGKETSYALSYMEKKNWAHRAVTFVDIRNKKLTGLEKRKLTIRCRQIGSKFGESLCSADIDLKGNSELLVGAPAYTDITEDKEVGAVHIYSMTRTKTLAFEELKCTILGNKEGGGFGMVVAITDVNGDRFPEIFISAPYEDHSGALYIISGAEIQNTINSAENHIKLSNLRQTQRISGKGYQNFGFSIKIIPDIDENGCNELAVGSPTNSSVLLYRCIQNVKAEITTILVGSPVVSVTAKEFYVKVCVHISYPEKPKNINTKLLVKNRILGDSAIINDPIFLVYMSKRESPVCKNVTVTLTNTGTATYKFTAELDLDPESRAILNSADFQGDSIILSPFSKDFYITRNCTGEECLPNLSINPIEIGKNRPLLGSTPSDWFTVTVRNNGNDSYSACVRVKGYIKRSDVSGLVFLNNQAETGSVFYFRRLQRDAEETVNISINLQNLESVDTELNVSVFLYEDCENKENVKQKEDITILYYLDENNVFIDGSSSIRNISDKECNEKSSETLEESHEYLIKTNSTNKWSNLMLTFKMKMYDFITDYKILPPETDKCHRYNNYDNEVKFSCVFDLKLNETKKFIALTVMSKEKLKAKFSEKYVNISSAAELSILKLNTSSDKPPLRKTFEVLRKHSITTTIVFQKELSLVNNKLIIMIIGILLALIILAVAVVILYKMNFFKPKQKERLNELRESVRRKSVKRQEENNRNSEHTELVSEKTATDEGNDRTCENSNHEEDVDIQEIDDDV